MCAWPYSHNKGEESAGGGMCVEATLANYAGVFKIFSLEIVKFAV